MSNNLLKGKKGIIFGALDERSIAWITALRCHEEGAQIVLTNAPVALRMGEINKLAAQIGAIVIPCDVTSTEDIDNLLTKSMEHFGGSFDFILHSIGMSLNVRKGKSYTEIDYGFNAKTLDISATSLHRILAAAMKMDALKELSENGTAQIITTTHSPSLASLVNVEDIRFIYREGSENKIEIGSNDNLEIIADTLGVLPSLQKEPENVKVFLCVEGPTDIDFFNNISPLFGVDLIHEPKRHVSFLHLSGI